MALIECACGCGQLREDKDKKGRPRRYIYGHNNKSTEVRKACSDRQKGTKHTKETLGKMSKSRKGKHHSEETRKKISIGNKGKKLSDETKQKISEVQRGVYVGEKHHFYGKHHSEETREKISKALKGNKRSKETRKKISEAQKGDKHWTYGIKISEESRKKMSDAHMGKIMSKESRIKLSKSRRGENSHFWKGGISFGKYCVKFSKDLKNRVREFFGRQCFICGKSEMENGVKLAVHHVNYDKMVCCNDTEPLFVPLCKVCHSKTNFNRDYWQNWFEKELVKRTGGKSYYTVEDYIKLNTY